MKKIITLTAMLAMAIAIITQPSNLVSYSSTPPAAHTGNTAEQSCGKTTCHNNPANSGTGSLSIVYNASASTTYQAGQTYSITVQVTDAAATRGGFEMRAMDASNTAAGTFINASSGNNTTISTVASIPYISHNNIATNAAVAGTTTWNFQWTAPATGVGNITFYAASIAANGNGNDTGDFCYETTKVITFATDINDVTINPLKIYPSFVNQTLSLEGIENMPLTAKIISINGKETTTLPIDNASVDCSKLVSGSYILLLETQYGTYTQRFVKQ